MATVRFIPGPDQGDAEIVVLGVELHEDLVVVDVATTMLSRIERESLRHKLPSVMVEDDLGNSYRGKSLSQYGAGWSGRARVAHYAMEFRPRLPAPARFLRISFGTMIGKNRSIVVML
jgi:hypothetical protein